MTFAAFIDDELEERVVVFDTRTITEREAQAQMSVDSKNMSALSTVATLCG